MTVESPAWEALNREIEGEVVRPDAPEYGEGYKGFNARFHDVRPRAVVRCAGSHDVRATLAFLGRHGLEHAVRSGGHCFAGHSTTPGVVLAVDPMRSVSVADGRATVGAGTRLGHLYAALQEHDLTIPAGTCPPVGIAGLVLGGGLGILGRTYGVTSDSLVGAEVVLADGRVLECDAHHHEDLFWALRGAGAGNFGVVTSFVFRTVPAPAATNFHLTWPHTRAAAVAGGWQHWAPTAPDELAASLKITASGDIDQPPSVDVYGALLGRGSDATGLIEALRVRVGSEPTAVSQQQLSYPETRRFWANLGVAEAVIAENAVVQPEHPHLFAKSEFFRRPLPDDAIAALIEHFAQDRVPGESRELDFMPWGGAYNRVPADATAFVHRRELFQIKHAAVVASDAATPARKAAHHWVGRSWQVVHPWGSGHVFQNFADPDLATWPTAYYGANLPRLVQIKARYDPGNVFRFPQSLPVG